VYYVSQPILIQRFHWSNPHRTNFISRKLR